MPGPLPGLSPERSPGRIAVQGPHVPLADPLRRNALGHPPAVAALRRPLRPFRRPHRAARLRHARRSQRGAAGQIRADRRSAIRLPGGRAVRPDLGEPADLEASRRSARPRRDGGPNALLQGKHGAVGPRHAVRGRRGACARGGGRRRRQGLHGRRRRRPDARRRSRDKELGLGLSNLVFLVDWNDFGIDERPASAVVHGTPVDWFAPYGWRVTGTDEGMEWGPVTRAVLDAARGPNPDAPPTVAW